MMRRAAVLAALAAAACSSINETLDPKVDYKSQGTTLPTLEVPPDLTTPPRDSRFVVPETGRSSATLSGYQQERKEQARAGNAAVLPAVDNMRIERAGAERWLVVQEPPEKLWSLIRDFWQESGFLIKVEMPEAGVMETDWAENRARIPEGGLRDLFSKWFDTAYSTSERDKYRTRLERAPDGKGTEVYISHRGMREVYSMPRDTTGGNAQTAWEPRAPDTGLEVEFLRRLMVRLGAQQEQAKQLATVAAQPSPQRAEIRKGVDGAELLQVNEPFDRAWRRVGLALDRVGFTVEDRDRQKGLYFVRYADPEAEMDKKDRDKSIFSRWFSSDPKVKAEQYRVQIIAGEAGSQVNVLNKDGGADSSKTAQRILVLLHEQLK